MNLSLRPTTGLSRFLSDWPSTLLDRDFFDIESDLTRSRLGVNVPSVNIRETPKEYILEVAAPGLERKDFNIEVDNHTLSISAEKEEQKEEKSEDNGYSRKEYSFNSFTRSFTLPDDVKENNIDAKYDNGILKVTVPKAKESTAKTVKKINVS
ncbi:Hsp20/alpha crystallin family protein [Chryseolinea sp. H1M3-3]|uniref:Hsp20/alpha crystallin family protein n=1 Tax=Chryseolinea sp. H1M3-3 TaxID=3034144 RepID=UPI0023ECA276|nr:Hsp20/alpha crystallin family protein [Chryseolinea sp. H1M3-3]